jgi:biopolymer transport protein TolR
MAMGNLKKRGARSEINITPYIDILLVMLIIFMVTHPSQSYDIPIRVPQPPPPTQEKAKPEYIIVDILKDNSIQINQTPVTLQELGNKLKQVFATRPNRSMFIRAHPSRAFGTVFPVLDVAQQSGSRNIALIKSEENK